ncbi:hypothetical protein HNO86_02705 [Pseudomonas sp. C1C7]|uniref:hypothetical protein n=1 Tax=Pseudomonas sp. C1C7 TaxID=2735272 RepID=UPI0015864D26|nr:hypothetical protein [Pseudomonas sp. C1C7]NUT73948.1 hypothetical protein [Pseudomonas sp. C1C7]
MNFEQRLEFIDSLPALPKINMPRAFTSAPLNQPPHDPSKATASVMPDTINTFLPGASQQIIDDVNLCKLVMKHAADSKYDDKKQKKEWFQEYVTGLSKIGWAFQNMSSQESTIRRVGLTMDQVAFEIARNLLTADAASILSKVAKDAVGAVKERPQAISIFNRNYKLGLETNFDISPAWVDNYGQANMVLNCISLNARESTRGVLFWKSTTKSTTVQTSAVRVYLDNRTFSGLRAKLISKYTDAANKFIDNLPDF